MDAPSDHATRKPPAFLLLIPGATLMGFGVGLAMHDPAPGALVGLGAGLAGWGAIVAMRR